MRLARALSTAGGLLAIASLAAGGCATKGDRSAASTLLAAGTPAPDASALDQDGKLVRLADYRGKAVVLWFYPKDFTGG